MPSFLKPPSRAKAVWRLGGSMPRWMYCGMGMSSGEPVFELEARDAFKVLYVIGDHRGVAGQGNRGDQEVSASDGSDLLRPAQLLEGSQGCLCQRDDDEAGHLPFRTLKEALSLEKARR